MLLPGRGAAQPQLEDEGDGDDLVYPVDEINEKLLNECMGAEEWRTRSHKHITFSHKAFKLKSLDGLLEQPIDLSALESLDVSSNELENLACLEGKSRRLEEGLHLQGSLRFQSLKVLKARRNRLTSFTGVLPQLRELDLAYNQFTKMPFCAGIPKLEVLVVSHNRLQGTLTALAACEELRKLDISHNNYTFMPGELFKELTETLGNLTKLSALRLKENRFTFLFPEYQSLVLQQLPKLQKLDDIADMQEAWRMAEMRPLDPHLAERAVFERTNLHAESNKAGVHEETEHGVPTFAQLSSPLVEALQDSGMIPKTIKQLMRLTTAIARADNAHTESMLRKAAATQEEVEQRLKDFVVHYQALLAKVGEDGSWQNMLLRSLAKLHVAVAYDFGPRCIDLLSRQVQIGGKVADDTLAVIKEIIVEPLNARSLLDVVTIPTVRALAGIDCAEEKLADCLAPICGWLARMYCSPPQQQDITKLLGTALSKRANIDAALEGAASLGSSSGVQAQDLLPHHVVIAMDNKQMYQNDMLRELYIGHLRIVYQMAMYGPAHICEFYKARKVHKSLTRDAKFFFNLEGVEASEVPTKTLDTQRMSSLNIRSCSAVLDAVIALMTSTKTVFQELMEDGVQEDGSSRISILEYFLLGLRAASIVCNPMVMTSSINGLVLVLKTFPREDKEGRHAILLRVAKELNYMKDMLENIDPSHRKCHHLYMAAMTMEKSSKKEESKAPEFGNLTSPVMHRCFVAILSLIEFFTWEGRRDSVCADVSEEMNAQERERLVLRLLEIPNPKVQDAVMSVLKKVDMSELSKDEVGDLVQQVDVSQDQYIPSRVALVGKVILQLCMLLDYRQGRGAGWFLCHDHASNVIRSVKLTLLRSVQVRPLMPDDVLQGETGNPSLPEVCVTFLQKASKAPELRNPHMRKKDSVDSILRTLKYEDQHFLPLDRDIMCESTWTGRSADALLQCFFGGTRLRPDGKVAFRVMSRLADIIEGRTDMLDAPTESAFAAGVPTAQEQAEEEQPSAQTLAKAERLMWDEGKIRHSRNMLDDMETDDRSMQHRTFSLYQGLERILMFLGDLQNDDGRAHVEKMAAVASADRFLADARRISEKIEEQQRPEDDSVGPAAQLVNEDSSDSDAGDAAAAYDDDNDDTAPVIDFAGKDFPLATCPMCQTIYDRDSMLVCSNCGERRGDEDEAAPVDLRDMVMHQLGGALSILFTARWDSLNRWSRIIDFGSGTPQDNIVIANQGRTSSLAFQIYRFADGQNQKLTVAGAIEVGVQHRYLCTVSPNGHMKVFRDGILLGEKLDGWAPRPCRRDNLLIGGSPWGNVDKFCGRIEGVKVWLGKALEWDEAADEGEEEGNDNEYPASGQQEKADRSTLMKVLMRVDADEPPPKRPQLQGVDALAGTHNPALTISEELLSSKKEGLTNAAFIVAAAFRCIFSLLVVPTSKDILRRVVASLRNKITICRLISLAELGGPFNCCIAAKLLRLMSTALDLSADTSDEEAECVVLYDLLLGYYAKLCPLTVMAIEQSEHPEMAERGRVLGTEIVRLASVICRATPSCRVSKVEPAQDAFVEECLKRLMPLPVLNDILQMVMFEPKAKKKDGQHKDDVVDAARARKAKGQQNELWKECRAVFAQMLLSCPGMKYSILEVFSTMMVSGTVALRQAFLSSLLEQSSRGKQMTAFGEFFNRPENIKRRNDAALRAIVGPSNVKERILVTVAAEVWVGGKRLEARAAKENPKHPSPTLLAVLSTETFYIVDTTAEGFPSELDIVERHDLCDMTRIVQGGAPQLLHIGWVNASHDGDVAGETYVTLACYRDVDTKELAGKLHAYSRPYGGFSKHQVPMQSDSRFISALKSMCTEQMVLVSFVTAGKGVPVMFLLSEVHLFEFHLDFTQWLPPEDGGDVVAHDLDEEGGDAAPHEGQAAIGDKQGGGEATIPDKVAAKRESARMKQETYDDDKRARPASKVFIQKRTPRLLSNLDKVAFYPDRRPRMAIGFGSDTTTLVFYDDMARESWRSELMHLLNNTEDGSKQWSKSYG